MKTCNSKIKAHAFLGAAFVLLIALMFTACKQPASAEKPEPPAPPAPPKHAVTFSVEGTPPNGTLKAILGTSEITSGDKVEEGKWVIFTAKADDGYRVKEWKVDGTVIKNKSNTYAHNVTKPAAITVSFEPYSVKLTLSPDKNTVKVKAKTKDGSAMKVEGCTVTELTSDVETTLTAIGTKVTLIGDIIELNCSGEESGNNRPLIALDTSGCTALQKLNCQYNKITALNVQGLTALQELECYNNQLATLNVQGCASLQKLNCQGNKLSTLNVQGLKALKELQCNDNVQLATLNVQGCTALQKLNCRFNKIAELDVSGLTALQELDCQSNQLKTLDAQGLTALQKLDCSSNQLITLNVRGLTALQELYCEKNQLATLNVQGCASLQKLYCNGSEAHRYLSELNVQGCTALKELLCYYNKLNADVFTKLFNDLPTREASDGATAILYVDEEDVTEENCTDFTQPESLKAAFDGAKAKHWKMKKMAGYLGEDI